MLNPDLWTVTAMNTNGKLIYILFFYLIISDMMTLNEKLHDLARQYKIEDYADQIVDTVLKEMLEPLAFDTVFEAALDHEK